MSRRINRLLVGPPGVGKTESIKASYHYTEVLLLSSCVEEDIYGLPYRDGEFEKRTVPPFLVRLRAADAGGKSTCLFLDELDKARKEVADTLLTLVASRKTPYGLELPERTEIVAAANSIEFGGGDGISIPMLNRFSVQDFTINLENWKNWAYSQFKEPKIREIIDLFSRGEAPILDSVGEGLSLRITSPRSIAYSLESVQQFLTGALSYDEVTNDIMGLLTAATSAQVISKLSSEDTPLIEKTTSIVRKITSRQKNHIYRGS